MSEARASTEQREAALREAVADALKRLRAYARDMEVGLSACLLLGGAHRLLAAESKRAWPLVRTPGTGW